MQSPANPAVEYLRANKDKFPLDVLRRKLAEEGYPKESIDQAVLEVFQIGGQRPAGSQSIAPKVATGFFDFRNVKTYHSFREKLGDFLFGGLLSWLIDWFVGGFFGALLSPLYTFSYVFGSRFYGFDFGYGFGWISSIAIFAVHIFFIFYFWKRRHYLASGLLFAILLSLILVLVILGLGFWLSDTLRIF